MEKILYLSHNQAQCGVWQFGDKLGKALLKHGNKYEWIYHNIGSEQEYWDLIGQYNPALVLINYYPSTMPWLNTQCISRPFQPIKLGICHEEGHLALTLALCGHAVILDPTYTPSETVYCVSEGILDYENTQSPPDRLTIGSFGFGFGNKGYTRIINQVQSEFDEALIRLHLPAAVYRDWETS